MITSAPMLTAEQVAEKLNISRATVYRWAALGLIPPPFRRGRTVRFHSERIQTLLASDDAAQKVT